MDRVELVIELKGDQEALQKLRELQNLVNKLNGQKITPTVNSQPAETAMGKLKRLFQDTFNKDQKLNINSSAVDTANTKVNDLKNNFSALDDNSVALNVDASGITAAQSAVAGLASALQGLSTLMSTVGGALTTTGGWLQNMSGLFGGNIAGTSLRTMIGYATVLGIQGLGKAEGRFDTFRTFPKMMEAMGFSAEEAELAIEKLNQAVLGTPTALDEIMDLAQDFILLTGDMEKGTQFAIAANNAFLANGSDAQQVYYGMRQLRDLFSKGGLREQEWDSLFSAMGVSIGVIGEEMGYTTENIGKFKAALKNIGTEDAEFEINDFIDAIIRAGTETGKLTTMVDVGKDTLTASLTNIKTAISNLGASLLQETDTLLLEKYGRGLPDTLKMISDAIKQTAIPGAKNWLNENFDSITELIEKFTSFNWGKLAGNIADNALKFFETVGKILEYVGEDNIINLVSFATVWAGPLGKAMTLLGGLFNTAGQLFGSLGGGLGRISGQANGFIATSGYMGLITELALGFKELAKSAEVISAGDFENLSANLEKMKDLIFLTAGIATALTAAGTAIGAVGGGLAVGTGELLAGGLVAIIGEIGLVMKAYAEALQTISTIDADSLPDADTITQFIGILAAFQNGISDKLLGARLNTKNIDAINGALEAIQTIYENQDVFKNLGDMDIDFNNISSKVETMGDGMTSIVQSLLDHFGENGGVRTIQMRGAIVKSIGDIITELDETSDKLYELRQSMYKLGIKLSSGDGLDENSAYGVLISKIEAMVEGLKSVSDSISDDELDALFTAIKTKLETHIIENYKETISVIQDLADVTNTLDFGDLGLLEEDSAFEDMKTKIGVLLTGIRDVLSIFNTNIFDWDTWFQGSKSKDSADIVTNISESMNAIADILNSTKESFDLMGEIDFRKVDMFSRNVSSLLSAISDVMGNMEENGASSVEKVATATQYKDAMIQIAEMLKVVAEMSELLNDITENEVIVKLTDMIAGLGLATDQIPEDMDEMVERITMFATVVEMLGTMVETVAGMQEMMAEMRENEENVPEEVGGLLDQLLAMIGGIDFEEEDMDRFALLTESITALDEALLTFMEGTLTSFMEQLQELIDKIVELTDPTLENLRSKEEETEQQTDDLKFAVEELGDMCDAKKPSVDALADSIVRLGEVAQSSAGMVRELAAAIDSLHDKTVTISVVMNTSGLGNPLLPNVYPQNGGPIYRAGGGSVFFKPRGSDTVPAMLTPGEFVMRKTAVDKIGVPILSMLNSMNIPGAIDALIAKIHLPVSSGVVSYDNRRTYDNHATVNQYISTNNPAYTYRRASRFAHAL